MLDSQLEYGEIGSTELFCLAAFNFKLNEIASAMFWLPKVGSAARRSGEREARRANPID